jgi:hypothetical protein
MKVFLAIVATFVLGTCWAAGSPPGPQGPSVNGVVLEVRDVDAYTYLRLRTKDGETWAAVNKATVKKGAEVTIENAHVMNNFESKTLKKTFDKIVFGNLAGAGTVAGPAGGDLNAVHGGLSKVPDAGDTSVPKATGPDARTVAEVVAKKAELKDKPVTIRGKVVKYTSNVMGKNWIHLRDGSGSATDNTNDVLVTTQDQTLVGAVVVAKGVVRTDVDLGAGYSYKVLVDDARLQK